MTKEMIKTAVEQVKMSATYAKALAATICEYERQNPDEKVIIGGETFKRLDSELTELFICKAIATISQ